MRIARDIAMAILHAATLEEFRPAGQSLVELPAKMPDFPVLRVLDLSGNQLRSLPAWVFDLPDLEVLNLKGNQLDFIPSAIHRLRQLKRLQVDHNPIQGLPNLPPGLQEVHANGCPIERFPESVLRCPGIELVEMKGCRLREIPAHFSLPSNMQRLDLQGNFLSAFPHDLVAAAHIDDLRIHGNPFLEALGGNRFADTLAGFFADASKRQLPLPDRNCQLDILLEDTVRAGLNTSSRLLDSLESPFAAVREKAHKVLPKVLENPFHKPLPEFVCLAGRFSLVKISVARDAIQAAGSIPSTQVTNAGTLVVLGTAPGRLLAEARAKGCMMAMEAHLADWIAHREGHFLEAAAADHPMVGNLMALLQSFQAPNIEMAMAIMAGGGTPPAALQQLLAIRLFHPDADLRNKAAAAWQPCVAAPLRDAVSRAWKEAQLEDGLFNSELLLRRLLERPELDAACLVQTAMSLQKTGLGMVHLLPAPQQAGLYAQALSRGSLNLAKMGLQHLPEGILELQGLHGLTLQHNGLQELPEAIRAMTQLNMLDLSHNSLQSLPQSLGALTGLVSLDLSHNRLLGFPEAACQLPSLAALRLSHNPIPTLPDALPRLRALEYLGLRGLPLAEDLGVLEQLPQLRELDLGECGFVAVPGFLQKLPLLEGLNLDRNAIATLPEWLGEMPRLRHLDLSYLPLTQLPVGLASARRLERIYLLQDQSMDWMQVTDVLARIPTLKHVYLKRYKIVAEMERHMERGIRQARVQFV